MREHGCDIEMVSPARCVEIEPALKEARHLVRAAARARRNNELNRLRRLPLRGRANRQRKNRRRSNSPARRHISEGFH